ncbi:hypothetical protein FRC03_011986 [Tulasnella sp. 419]|nr:hypothetical protein FRC03_011986 [Tulasnella sp. 419]
MSDKPTVEVLHNGPTKLAFSKDGRKIYTAGEDSTVRVWDAEGTLAHGQEAEAIVDTEDAITSIAAWQNGWVIGTADAKVQRHGVDNSLEGFVTQTGGMPVRCVAFSPSGDMLAVGSDELTVKVVDMEDTLVCSVLQGHKRGLRAASWHPTGKQLITSGQDGKIIVWDMSEPDPAILQEIDGLLPVISDPTAEECLHDATAVWHPNGKYFVVATKSHDIVGVSSTDWKKVFTFPGNEHSSHITALNISQNGRYVASAGTDGLVIVWDTESRKPLFRSQPDTAPIINIAFSPSANLLAWSTVNGALIRWQDVIPSSHPAPHNVNTSSAAARKSEAKKSQLDTMFDDDDDVDPRQPLPGAESKQKDGIHDKKASKSGDDDDFFTKLKESERAGGKRNREADNDEDDEDWVVNDLGEDFRDGKERFEEGAREMVNVTKAQPAFQPGSTPFRGKKRYLAFNSIGVIDVVDQDIHHVVNIQFHDKSLRQDYHFQDVFRYAMASLGERGILFAGLAEDKHPGVVCYKPYESWASNSEWQLNLPPGEDPVAVAAGGAPYSKYMDSSDLSGNGHLAVATTKGFVRFFSGGGSQRYIWNVGGELVTMAAGSEWLFAIHREGGTSLDGCQNLRYTLVAFDSFDVIQTGYLPLPKGSTLSWIGISDEGAPAIYDSNGLLSVMDRFRRPTQGRWVPVLDTNSIDRKSSREESYWAVGLSSTEFTCVILKGGEKVPGFPRPMVQELPIHMPLLDLESPQAQLEEKFLRESIRVTMLRDATGSLRPSDSDIARQELSLDKELIQLIQAACKGDKLQRALDAARLLHHLNSYEGAQKVAGFYHLVGLQEKIGMLRDAKRARDSDDDDEGSNPRRNWGKVMEPVGRPNGLSSGVGRPSRDLFTDDFATTSVVPRRTLALATPIGEVAFGRPATATRAPTLPPTPQYVEESSMEVESSFALSDWDAPTTAGSSKRKRDEGESGEIPRKRTNGTTNAKDNVTTAPSKPAVNPFAKKPAPEKSANPFARNVSNNKSIVKSNSFFEKVDAAEAGADLPKKGAKDAKGKQTTLFGQVVSSDKKASKPKKAKGDDAPKKKEKEKAATPAEVESQEEMSDVIATASNLFGDTQTDETQLETQPDDNESVGIRAESPDWEVDNDEGGGEDAEVAA